ICVAVGSQISSQISTADSFDLFHNHFTCSDSAVAYDTILFLEQNPNYKNSLKTYLLFIVSWI
ncbi:MAG: hypothetical protein ACRC1Z_17110, partial [Waterburya sp.]